MLTWSHVNWDIQNSQKVRNNFVDFTFLVKHVIEILYIEPQNIINQKVESNLNIQFLSNKMVCSQILQDGHGLIKREIS